MYGGAAPNAVFGLVELLAKMKDANGVIQIPGMYDDVEAAGAGGKTELVDRCRSMKRSFSKTKSDRSRLTGEPGYTVLERVWARPTLEVHGIAGGFTAAGAKTVIPAKATAKVSMRLVPKQDPEKIIAALQEVRQGQHAHRNPDRSASAERGPGDRGESGSSRDPRRRARRFRDILGRETVFIRSGGSIPIVGDFARHLGIPTILMGFGLPDDGLHSPNEKYKLVELLRRDHDDCPFL